MYKQKQTETNMLDATVKFEDVAADIIALEDVIEAANEEDAAEQAL